MLVGELLSLVIFLFFLSCFHGIKKELSFKCFWKNFFRNVAFIIQNATGKAGV